MLTLSELISILGLLLSVFVGGCKFGYKFGYFAGRNDEHRHKNNRPRPEN